MAAAIPNAVFVLLEGPNHVLLDGEPAQARFFKELQDFMRDCAVEYTKSHLEMAVVPRIADMIGGPDRLANTKPTNVRNCEGFRRTAHRARLPLALGPSSESLQ